MRIFIDLFIINTNTGLMIKKVNKKYTLTCINDKKGQQKIYIDLY